MKRSESFIHPRRRTCPLPLPVLPGEVHQAMNRYNSGEKGGKKLAKGGTTGREERGVLSYKGKV
jgi:hypothetical protein